jgi:glutamine synthetase
VHALFDQLQNFGIPIEGLHTETGDGVYEACIEYPNMPGVRGVGF